MLYRKISYIIFTILISLTIISCSDDSTSVDGSTATINGSVESSSESQQEKSVSQQNEGIVVTAARVTSSGTIETIGETETETNASGEFSLEVDTDVANHIIITAQTQSGELKGHLSAAVQNGQSYTLKPINAESSAEAEVFMELVADGNADMVQKSDIDATVTSEVAAQIQTNNSAAAEVAAGLVNYSEAKADFLADMGESEVEAKLNQAAEAKSNAQFQYEAELAGSSSADENEAAFDLFLESYLNAYTEAGFEHESVAKLAHMRVNVIQNTFSSASADVAEGVKSSTSLFAALAVDAAAQTNAEASGMSDATVLAIADAGASLKSEIKASADVEAAFESYHNEVRQAMENDSSTEAGVILEIDSEINAGGGSKAVFNSALSNVISANILSDLYLSFTNSIESNVESKSEVMGELNTEAMANLFIIINLNS